MDKANIIRLSIAIIVGYATLFLIIWIFKSRNKKDDRKSENNPA
jgi:uncharacterized membrane protein YuzA (DUF378 family)